MRQQRKYSYLISFFFNGQFDNIVLDAKRPISQENIRNYEAEIENTLLYQDGYPNNLMGSLRIIAISPLK